MSKKRKITRGNPARQDRINQAKQSAQGELANYMRTLGSEALDKTRQEVIDAGASEFLADKLLRMARLRIAWEALEAGAPQVFEWVMEPVVDEIEIMGIMTALEEKADEIGTPWENL